MNNSCGKIRYVDKKAALSAINFRQRRHNGNGSRRGKVKHLRAYACPQCRAWHITRTTNRPHRRNHFSVLYHD